MTLNAYGKEALSLKDCYQLALKRSETVAINEQVIKEAEGQFWQSLSTALPVVNYQISNGWQDRASGDNSQGIRYRRFTFSQSLFSGFKEFAAISGSKAQSRQRQEELNRAKQLLFKDVSDAFFNFQSYQEDLFALDLIHKALMDRLEELKRRRSLGRSREGEVASAEASVYRTEADQEGVRNQLNASRQLLEFLIGEPVEALKLEDLPTDPVLELKDLLVKADVRPDIKASRDALIISKKNLTIAQAGSWPTVSLAGNSYQLRSNSDNDWDITLNVNIPLFDGALTYGKLKQAKSQVKVAELNLSQAQRRAALEIQNSYFNFNSYQKRMNALMKASDAAKRNYELQSADYKNNLVSNLDVIDALHFWESGYRNFIVIKNEAKRSYWNLKVAVGDVLL